jgi:hypothetical protein
MGSPFIDASMDAFKMSFNLDGVRGHAMTQRKLDVDHGKRGGAT